MWWRYREKILSIIRHILGPRLSLYLYRCATISLYCLIPKRWPIKDPVCLLVYFDALVIAVHGLWNNTVKQFFICRPDYRLHFLKQNELQGKHFQELFTIVNSMISTNWNQFSWYFRNLYTKKCSIPWNWVYLTNNPAPSNIARLYIQ